ncbi:MAG: hypothetical protein GXP59_02530 [Deltaproteobacteria bacterium]|nr:hypothetical protein [Deltaproteobacteria bacterium]
MKKVLVAAMALALVAGGASLAMAAPTISSGIVGSPHDFSADMPGSTGADGTWNTTGEICRVCHSPHDKGRSTYKGSGVGLLWNHDVSSATYTLYTSDDIPAGDIGQPVGNAKLCLGCHDGTVGIDSFDNHTALGSAPTNAVKIGSGTDPFAEVALRIGGVDGTNGNTLAGTHPISADYPVLASDPATRGFNDPTAKTWADGELVSDTLENGMVQCATCHDVHSRESVAPATGGENYLLRQAQTVAQGGTASGLCLTCHNK